MRTIDEQAVKNAGGTIIPNGISVGNWRFTSTRGPIASDAACESFKDNLHAISIPEQYFNTNSLAITHLPTSTTFSFNAEDALRQWKHDNAEPIRVPAAEKWKESRQHEMQIHNAKRLEYDWTFSTTYKGTFTDSSSNVDPTNTAEHLEWSLTGEQMDRAMLTSRDAILFFDDIPLYESELEDNGVSTLSVKIRVMPKCWFVLMRFFLRVDRVLVKLREVRLFGKMESNVVLREIKYQEGTFIELEGAGAPGAGANSAYVDGDAAAVALAAVAPVGVVKYVVEKAVLSRNIVK